MLRIGIDIGGTFTDFAVWKKETDGYTDVESFKIPTSRPDFSQAVIDGISQVVARHRVNVDDPVLVVHSTTISTNAVIERSQPPIALFTTKGFRDVLGIARLRLDKPIDLFNRRVTPLVPRERVFEITERVLADGSVERELDEASVISALDAARQKGATAVGVSLLNSYVNPRHEQVVLELAAKHHPDLEVVASSDVWPQQSEYERAVLTLLNVYVKSVMDGYLEKIDTFLSRSLKNAKLFVMKSNGGMMSASEARSLPAHTLLSGPAAGVTAAKTLGEYLDLDRVLTFDMGGTSTDVSLIEGGRPMISAQAEVGEFPVLVPSTAVEAIGAGGGSVVWLDGGILKVGPRSAGSKPGPACYGLGGTEPTLSDAYLICGLLPDTGLLGGKLALDVARAETAFKLIADTLGISVEKAAESAIAVATSNMMAKLLPFLARVGVGPTDCTLMLYGGAGAVHGPLLADEIGVRRIVVPRVPSVFCAFGCLVSDLLHDTMRNMHGTVLSDAALAEAAEQLRVAGEEWVARQGEISAGAVIVQTFTAEMRYAAQSFTLPVELELSEGKIGSVQNAFERFHAEHERLFGHASADLPVVIDALRLRTAGKQEKPAPKGRSGPSVPVEPRIHRRLRINGKTYFQAPVFSQGSLEPGFRAKGPAMVEQEIATVVVPPDYWVEIGPLGDIVMTRDH
ncbi:hydantoinase/oxoprolinase family protein [Pararhizobium arenae]|uniref:hydantoinase/oxoprolinase family protein n=1 Tax=Pararhizobium arenae TaxID=1856850 RepID=UPI00094B3CF8|nr:hydantoinase/oxoprolinase family protein [Pararhizobium arenae]